MPSPFLYYADHRLSVAELTAARLDGHVVELGDAYIPADAVETAALRAGSLRDILGTVLAATHLSAAWIHDAVADPPPRHTVQRAVPRRLHHVLGRRFRYRDAMIPPQHLTVVGGVNVTDRVRTLVDLAREGDDAHGAAAAAMTNRWPGLAEEALALIAASGPFPGKRPAAGLIARLSAERTVGLQDEVTRYTS
jgi:hypothetical protein